MEWYSGLQYPCWRGRELHPQPPTSPNLPPPPCSSPSALSTPPPRCPPLPSDPQRLCTTALNQVVEALSRSHIPHSELLKEGTGPHGSTTGKPLLHSHFTDILRQRGTLCVMLRLTFCTAAPRLCTSWRHLLRSYPFGISGRQDHPAFFSLQSLMCHRSEYIHSEVNTFIRR